MEQISCTRQEKISVSFKDFNRPEKLILNFERAILQEYCPHYYKFDMDSNGHVNNFAFREIANEDEKDREGIYPTRACWKKSSQHTYSSTSRFYSDNQWERGIDKKKKHLILECLKDLHISLYDVDVIREEVCQKVGDLEFHSRYRSQTDQRGL